ncbi:hypothetical protein P1J78_05290 [Psychromarinibacter sp. C21-152]|uniref:Uncharacterized protein n=1 Tax=Psychromarinibacter sediminicola TaxID=3033385 RepID=A0AAE3NLP6_9RHOB|nr:hypothetical protein [Psychromarinibacter sediminicola]MDF0600138.1 hypothetical protein [Psychromarinibacter sediminicola]
MSDEIIATLAPSQGRRWIAVAMLLVLGGLLLWLAFSTPAAALLVQLFLLGLGLAALVMAELIRRATETWIELTEDGLRDGTGRELCRMDRIAAVERGAFAFKPSNGFLVRLTEPGERAWQPGLWWRFGRRVGVGGVTPAGQGKFMADMIALRLRERG